MASVRLYMVPLILLLLFGLRAVIPPASISHKGCTPIESRHESTAGDNMLLTVSIEFADADDVLSIHAAAHEQIIPRCFTKHEAPHFLPVQYAAIPTPPPWCII